MTLLRTTTLAAAAFLFLGCGGDDGGGANTGGAGGTGATGGSGGGGTGGGGTGGGAQCATGPGYETATAPQQIDSLVGKLTVLDGLTPAPNTVTTVCGTDICIFGSTDAGGNVVTCDNQTKVCTPGILPGQALTKPAFKYALGINYAKFALLLPAGATHDVGTQITAPFPALGSGAAMNAGESITNSGVTLTIAAGSKIQLEPDFITDDEKQFRAVEIPTGGGQIPQAVDLGLGFEILIATTPVDTHFCPNAKLSVPNTSGWAAGTEVEFWVHGVGTDEEWAPYGGWGKVSGGAVSSDGAQVVTADGEGVPLLSVFGIRKKP